MKKLEKIVSASYCCESSTEVDINQLVDEQFKVKKTEKIDSASYCCESSTAVDIRNLVEEVAE